MNELELKKYTHLFDEIKHIDKDGNEFWSARELMAVLGYDTWENFTDVIEKAKTSFSKSGIEININVVFRKATKSYKSRNRFGEFEAEKPDYRLARYACYLIAQNGNPTKLAIATAQSYFAFQTYKQEEIESLTDDQKRLYIRNQVIDSNSRLFKSAKDSGVNRYGEFYDAGYLGLYGMRNKQICKKKGIGKDKLLDRGGSTELAMNLFRITQTHDKLESELKHGNKLGQEKASETHFGVAREIRKTVEKIQGTMPEDLPPEEDIKKLEKRINTDSSHLLSASKPVKLKGTLDENVDKLVS